MNKKVKKLLSIGVLALSLGAILTACSGPRICAASPIPPPAPCTSAAKAKTSPSTPAKRLCCREIPCQWRKTLEGPAWEGSPAQTFPSTGPRSGKFCRRKRPWRDPPLKERPVPPSLPRRDLPQHGPPSMHTVLQIRYARGPAPGNFSCGRTAF